jgi:nucleotide-binding universal stress UspA family protein
MNKILVPTDFSECAEAATQVAMAIAEKADSEIYFLHLQTEDFETKHVPHPESSPTYPDERKRKIAQARNELERLVVKAGRAGIKSKQELVLNKSEERLEDYIKPYGIDLVVMGSNGTHGLRELLIGSNTERLIWHSPVPVLVIKSKPEKFEINNMVFVSDFKTDFVKPLKEILKLASLWNSQLHLLYVNTPSHFRETNDVLADMKRFMHQFNEIQYTPHIYDANDEERGIHQFAKANKVDLIALATHGRTAFMALTHSIAECLINHEKVPVLVVNMDVGEKLTSK